MQEAKTQLVESEFFKDLLNLMVTHTTGAETSAETKDRVATIRSALLAAASKTFAFELDLFPDIKPDSLWDNVYYPCFQLNLEKSLKESQEYAQQRAKEDKELLARNNLGPEN